VDLQIFLRDPLLMLQLPRWGNPSWWITGQARLALWQRALRRNRQVMVTH
jgi:hypothetical protein